MDNGGAKAGEGKSKFTKAYRILRWPVALGLFAVASVFFVIGLLNSLGYNGTTELRKIRKDSQEWIAFDNSFSSNPTRGTPFMWNNMRPVEDGDYVNFDSRLVKTLEYLKNGAVAQTKNNVCGWSSSHENLTIDVDYSSKLSVYSVPPDKTTPISTIYRGVGLRIAQADYIKCTIHPRNPAEPHKCLEAPTHRKFPPGNSNGFPISLASNSLLTPEQWPYDEANCQVTCAIDYYPFLPDPVASTPPTYNKGITDLAKIDPSVPFDYEQITPYSKKAGLLKTILLAYELTHIDDKGCESAEGNTGNQRLIPVTMIVQNWVRDGLGKDGWSEVIKMANQKFPFNFQSSSKLAALSSDPVLNILGFHWNF